MKHDLIRSHGIIVHILVFSLNVDVCLLDRIITLLAMFFWLADTSGGCAPYVLRYKQAGTIEAFCQSVSGDMLPSIA